MLEEPTSGSQDGTAASTALTLGQAAFSAFDQAFAAFSEYDEEVNGSTKLQRLATAIFGLPAFGGPLHAHGTSITPSTLFSHELTESQRSFIASVLLQAETDDVAVIPRDLEHRTISLYDSVLEPILYRELGISAKEQTYRKVAALKEAVITNKQRLRELPQKFSIDGVSAFQQAAYRLLKSRKTIFFAGPFVDISVLDSSLKTCITKIISYKEAEGLEVIDKYRTAEAAAESFLGVSKHRSNQFCNEILLPLAKSILSQLKDDFSQSPYGKDTLVRLYGAEKRYPRNIDGPFNIRCILDVPGPGMAFNVSIKAEEVTSCRIVKPEVFLGSVEPGRVVIEFPVIPDHVLESYIGEFRVEWMNGSREVCSETHMIEFHSQKMNVDWKAVKFSEPYVIDEVDSVDEFVGRTDLLDGLEALVSGVRVGSAFISGQKRVGKTSLAKTLKSIIDKKYGASYLTIYVEGGLYIRPSPEGTIAALGNFLCCEISANWRELKDVERPSFGDALSPLVEYLRRVKRVAPGMRILFMLDEFDELPIDLYRPNEISNAFFLSLRSVANEKDFGFIMIGGEKMPYILNCQGHALNKFESFRVDYFDRSGQWDDFADLVRRPSKGILDFTDGAITALYEKVNGHPFYTKLICKKLFRQMVDRRDSHVTEHEINEAYATSIDEAKGNSFQHFWTDGIFEPEPKAETVRTERRKFLIALSECISSQGETKKGTLLNRAERAGLNEEEAKRILQAFIAREIIEEIGGLLRCKVPFFAQWLKQQGANEIITTMSTLDAVLEYKKAEQSVAVQSEEIMQVVAKWGNYAGRKVSEDAVRAWLGQFGDNFRQRSMFHILKAIRFYTEDDIRSKMRVANGIVTRGRVWQIESGKRKRDDIFVSYIDGPGKSGARYAKLYADENGVYSDNVIEKGAIEKVLSGLEREAVLVFVDDFVGTGDSVSGYMREMAPILWTLEQQRKVSVHFVAVCGFKEGLKEVDNTIQSLGLSVKTNCIDALGDADKCFSETSKVFDSVADRVKAREIAYETGVNLEKNAPLGFGACEAAVVFEDSCPNNCLPILWSRQKNWIPLFRRM